MARDVAFQEAVGRLRRRDTQQHRRRHHCHCNTFHDRRHLRNMDHERHRAFTYILWCPDNLAKGISGDRVHHLRLHLGDDRQLVDNHRHYRSGIDGYRQGTGFQRRHDCGSHHLRSLFRRQDFPAFRHHRHGRVNLGQSPVQAYQVLDAHHSTDIRIDIDIVPDTGIPAQRQRLGANLGLYGDIGLEIQHQLVDIDRTARDGHIDREENAGAAGTGHFNGPCSGLRHHPPAAHHLRNRKQGTGINGHIDRRSRRAVHRHCQDRI